MKWVWYKVATPEWRLGLNRYPNAIIGAYVVLGPRCLSLVWRSP
jgi:hypothetical protein